ncbi:hypothetical protein O3M35_001736 [Rhynocoris fuscipes]|uniref:DUF4773 domain-containing protein n=1 Tax=Rhynocoris fuscipes TaxID=488301 RepID=A0AAW1CPG8_9HEMI
MNLAGNRILFISFMFAVFIKINEGAELNNFEIIDELNHIIENYANRSFGGKAISFSCKNLTCTGCIGFVAVQDYHELCLIGEFIPDELGIYMQLNFDNSSVWSREFYFNTLCYKLPPPLRSINVCLELYNTRIHLPEEAEVCLRAEMSIIYPVVNFNITCINYEKGKGIWFSNAAKSKSNALIDIYMNDGELKITFNKLKQFIYSHRIIDLLKYQSKEIEHGETEEKVLQ